MQHFHVTQLNPNSVRFGGDFLRRAPRGEYLTAASADRREPLRKFWQFAQASMHFPRQKLLSSMLGAMSTVVAQWPRCTGSEQGSSSAQLRMASLMAFLTAFFGVLDGVLAHGVAAGLAVAR